MMSSECFDIKSFLIYSVFIFVVKGYMNLNVSANTSRCSGTSLNMSCVVDHQTTSITLSKSDGLYVGYCLAPLGKMDTVCTSYGSYKIAVFKSGTLTTIILTIPSLNISEHNGIWKCEHGNTNSSVWISVISPFTALVKFPVITTSPVNGGTVSNVAIKGHVYCQNTELTSELLYKNQIDVYKVLEPQPIWSDVDVGNNSCDYGEKNKTYTTSVTRTMPALRGKTVTFKIRFNQTACNSSFTTTSSKVFFFSDPPDDNRTFIKGIGAGSSLALAEGEKIKLQCEVRGGVPLAVIKWNCFGGTVTNTSVEGIARSTVTFTATDSQNGKFCTCSATHPVAVIAETLVLIHIKYAAYITSMVITGNNFTVNENSEPQITCNSDGFPAPIIELRHVRSEKVLASTTGYHLNYKFAFAKCEESGQYRCDANNNLNAVSSITKELYVLCLPRRIDKTESKIAFASGGTLNISTMYLAYPKPNFFWYFQNEELCNKTELKDFEKKLQINNTFAIENNVFRHGSLILRNRLEEQDFGTYTVIATNAVGSSIDTFIVSAEGKLENIHLEGKIAGSFFGGFVMALLITLAAVFVYIRKRTNQVKETVEDHEINDFNQSRYEELHFNTIVNTPETQGEYEDTRQLESDRAQYESIQYRDVST